MGQTSDGSPSPPEIPIDRTLRVRFTRDGTECEPPGPGAARRIEFRGVSGVEIVNARAGYSIMSTEDDHLMVDMNGDGFPDAAFVDQGTVKVKLNDGTGQFGAEQTWGDVALDGRYVDVPEWNTSSRTGTFPVDTMMKWTAPIDGAVTLTGQLRKVATGGDGIRASIWWDGLPGEVLWSESDQLAGNSTALCFPNANRVGCSGYPIRVPMQAGQSLYFLVDPRVDATADDVEWSPIVTYDAYDPALNRKEPTGQPIFKFSQAEDFRLNGRPEVAWIANATGQVTLSGYVRKSSTSDSIRVQLTKLTGTSRQVLASMDRPADAEGAVSLSVPSTTQVSVQSGDRLVLEVVSDAPIDPGRIEILNPRLTYDGNFCRERREGSPLCGNLQCASPGTDCHIVGDAVMMPDATISRAIEPSFPIPDLAKSGTTVSAIAPAASIHVGGSAACGGVHGGPGASGVLLVQGVNRLFSKEPVAFGSPVTLNLDLSVAQGDQISSRSFKRRLLQPGRGLQRVTLR